MRATFDSMFKQGIVANQASEIANRAHTENRVIDVAETIEARRSQEQDARFQMERDRQAAAIKQQAMQAQAAAARDEDARVQKQLRYMACVSAMASLESSLDKAKLACLQYQ
jgi:biopolymer transport protein ExbB/TolQ